MQQFSLDVSKSSAHQSAPVPQVAPPPPAGSGSLTGPAINTPQPLPQIKTYMDDSAREQYNHQNIEMNSEFRAIYDGPPRVTGLYDVAAQLANELVASKERRGNILA